MSPGLDERKQSTQVASLARGGRGSEGARSPVIMSATKRPRTREGGRKISGVDKSGPAKRKRRAWWREQSTRAK